LKLSILLFEFCLRKGKAKSGFSQLSPFDAIGHKESDLTKPPDFMIGG